MSIDIMKIEAIDPPGCGCTECIIGEYIPLDSPYIDKVLEAVLDGLITPRNNQNDGTLIIYRVHGRVHTTTDSQMLRSSDMVVVLPTEDYAIDEDDEDQVDVSKIESDYYDDDDEEKKEASIMKVMNGATAVNSTYETYIAYRSRYGETGIINLPVSSEDDFAILLYDD